MRKELLGRVLLWLGGVLVGIVIGHAITPTPSDRMSSAVAAKPTPVDTSVLKPEYWHRAIYGNAEYVVYTGPGNAMFHHWVPPSEPTPPAKKAP